MCRVVRGYFEALGNEKDNNHTRPASLSSLQQTKDNGFQVGRQKFSRAKKALGGAVASWLVRSTPEREVLIRALAGDIVLCYWARHFTLTVPLSATRCINGYRRI